MGWLQVTLILYGVLNIALGLIAYLHKGSVGSLMGGGGAGLIVLLAVLLTRSNPKIGYIVGAVVAVGLLFMFVPKYLNTREFYPPGLIVAASALVLIAAIVGHFTQPK